METENLIDNSKKKLEKKNDDMIWANSNNDKNAGFDFNTNKITLYIFFKLSKIISWFSI